MPRSSGGNHSARLRPRFSKRPCREWFEEDDDVPFMMQVFQIREEKRQAYSCGHPCRWIGPPANRLAETNPLYHRLIKNFRELTGIPMVLNTSFNENEPVVCKPRGAGLLSANSNGRFGAGIYDVILGVTVYYEYDPSGQLGFGGWGQ